MDVCNLLWRFRRKIIFGGILSFVLYLFYIESCPDEETSKRTSLHRIENIVVYNRRISDLRFNETLGDLGWEELEARQNLKLKRTHFKVDGDENNQSSSFSSVTNEISKDKRKITDFEKRLPQAIIIGVKKCGTRALLEYLRLHPKIVAPGPEIHFFDKSFEKGTEWYRKQMPKSQQDQLTIEKSPSYFITKEVPKRVFDMSPDTKLLLVVRDPVTRAISDHAQSQSKGKTKTFVQSVMLDESKKVVNTESYSIQIGMYAKHISRWLEYFPLSQILVVNGDELVTDPASVMARVQQFLNLDKIIDENYFFFNETKGFPCLKRDPSEVVPKCLDSSKGRHHSPVKPALLETLQKFYKPYNEQFFDLVKITFPWH